MLKLEEYRLYGAHNEGQRHEEEGQEYRDARDALLKEEQALIAKVNAVAEKRRKLPRGGQLKEDYTFQWPTMAESERA